MSAAFLLSLQLSIGLGYDLEDDDSYESRDFKGIVQVEKSYKDYSYGFWHSSQIDNGFKVNPEDQNILYIKRDFEF